MRTAESLFADSQWEIRIPNANIESLQEDYSAIIHAKPHETVPFYLQISLPDDLSTTHDETIRQVNDFFQLLEIQVEAAFVDALSLAASGPNSNLLKSPTSGGRPSSAPQSHLVDKRMSANSPGPNTNRSGTPNYGDQGRIESTLLYSYNYNPQEPGKEPVIQPVNGHWVAIFPFSVPVSFIRTKGTNTMLMLSSHVMLRSADQTVPSVAPVDDQYNLDCFSMVNLLEGLSDDPSFALSAVPQHHFRPDTPRARAMPPSTAPAPRRSVRRTIAVRSALNMRMRTTRVSPMENRLMMSIEVENNSEHGAKFSVAQLDVDVTNAVVASLDSAELTKLPLILHSADHVTFLFSVSLLDSPEWNSESPGTGHGGFSGTHRRNSSENALQIGPLRDVQRQVTIILQGTPEVDGVKGQIIHSRWNCLLDVSDLTKRENSVAAAAAAAANVQKQIYAPQPSHPSSSLIPNQPTPTLGSNPTMNHQQHQLHHRNQSLPSSPQPQQALQKGSTIARRVSTSGSPPVPSNRQGDGRARRSSLTSSVVSDGATQSNRNTSAQNSNYRKSVLSSWGYSRGNTDNQGLAPVQEGSVQHSPSMAHGGASDAGSYEDENVQVQLQVGRPAISGVDALSPNLGMDMVQGNGPHTRADHDGGDGIVVSFAVSERVVVGKIFNLEIFIVNRSRHIRRYTLVVPNRKRAKGGDPSQGSKVLPPLPSGEQAVVQNIPIDPYMAESELLRRHVDNETTEADIICLENNVRLSPLYPLTCQNLNLRFIAIKEQLHTIDLVQLVDNDTGFVTNLRNCLCFMAEASFGALSQQVPEVGNH